MASGEPLSHELLGALLPALARIKPAELLCYTTENESDFSTLNISLDCTITRLSEFFVTFSCDDVLPAKSVLFLNIGITLPLVVVNPFCHLDSGGRENNYAAFIFGLNEIELQLLRQAVNHYHVKEVKTIDHLFLKPIFENETIKKEETPNEQQKTEFSEMIVDSTEAKYYSKN